MQTTMQTTIATLLFVTSAVILACVVVDYTIVIFEQTLDTENSPQIDRVREIENMVLNQTDNLVNDMNSLNQTDTQQIEQMLP
jgi:hypothetical protein